MRIPRYADFPKLLFYSEIPLYTEQIKRYVNSFGWKQLHVIVFDDLVNNTLNTYREVLRFLEVDDQFTPELGVHNPGSQLKSRIVRDLIRNSWIERVARTFLSSTTRRRVGRLVLSHWNTKSRTPMDKHVRKRLQKQFAPEVERLSKLLNRDLSHWCKD